MRRALPTLDDVALARMTRAAARLRGRGRRPVTSRASWRPTGGFHFALFEHPAQPHALRLIRLLWDSTEAYRALYYNVARRAARPPIEAHRRILAAVRARDADALVAELDAHRERALEAVGAILRAADAA